MLSGAQEDVVKVYTKAIENLKLQQPLNLVRGEAPHGPAQYKACPRQALSAELVRQAAPELKEALSPLCIPALLTLFTRSRIGKIQ